MIEGIGPTVVIDNGSATIKAGFAAENVPRISFPNVIGRPRFTVIHMGMNPDYYIGEEAEAMANILRLTSPN
jgi:actin-related protein